MGTCYNNPVRRRWHDWVIVLSILALAVTGVVSIWGDDLLRLWSDDAAGERAPHPAPQGEPLTAPGTTI